MGIGRFLVDGLIRFAAEHDGQLPAIIALSACHWVQLLNESVEFGIVKEFAGDDLPGICVDDTCTGPYFIDEEFGRFEL
ncbi:hypothetical protein WJ58_28905 [Burkholderia ubonensis]|nr:hypothetical protein WJ58_28905 [Burkholderia ubonensis]